MTAEAVPMHERRPRRKVCFVISAPITAQAFLAPHIERLSRSYDVHVAANAPSAPAHPALAAATWHHVPIVRAISPWADLVAVAKLVRLLRRERFALVHSFTPKAGLASALAGWLARVPVRLHTFTGQVWATRNGRSRIALKTLDRLIAALNTGVLVDSASQRDFLVSERVLAPGKGTVLGRGSVVGIDPLRFRPDPAARAAVRARLGIPENSVLFLFVGRITRDKGVLDLAHAFGTLAQELDDVYLVVVGPDEENLAPDLRRACGAHAQRLRIVGETRTPEEYMAAADVFCLPSYREGFGAVIVEAAAAGLPAIASRIYGITDALDDGATGIMFDARHVPALAHAMHTLAVDAPLRRRLGAAARERALRDYRQDALTAALFEHYERALAASRAS